MTPFEDETRKQSPRIDPGVVCSEAEKITLKAGEPFAEHTTDSTFTTSDENSAPELVSAANTMLNPISIWVAWK